MGAPIGNRNAAGNHKRGKSKAGVQKRRIKRMNKLYEHAKSLIAELKK